jgi:hypothetical protein
VADNSRPAPEITTVLDVIMTLPDRPTREQMLQARVAAAVLVGSPRGKRDLADRSGLNENVAAAHAPWAEGERLGMLMCSREGNQNVWDPAERRSTRWKVVPGQFGNERNCPREIQRGYYTVSTSLSAEDHSLSSEDQRSLTLPGAVPFVSDLSTLNPALDLWRESQGRRDQARPSGSKRPVGVGCAGTTGWVLAGWALAGRIGTVDGELVKVTFAEIVDKLGIAAQNVRVLADRIQGAGFGFRRRGFIIISVALLTDATLWTDQAGDKQRKRHDRERREYDRGPGARKSRQDFLGLVLSPQAGPEWVGATVQEAVECWDQWQTEIKKCQEQESDALAAEIQAEAAAVRERERQASAPTPAEAAAEQAEVMKLIRHLTQRAAMRSSAPLASVGASRPSARKNEDLERTSR